MRISEAPDPVKAQVLKDVLAEALCCFIPVGYGVVIHEEKLNKTFVVANTHVCGILVHEMPEPKSEHNGKRCVVTLKRVSEMKKNESAQSPVWIFDADGVGELYGLWLNALPTYQPPSGGSTWN